MPAFNQAKEDLAQQWLTGTFMLAIFPTAFVADVDADQFWDDISAEEITGTNYPAGGIEITNKSVVRDDANNVVELRGDNVTFTNVTLANAHRYVIYRDSGTPATSPLYAHESFVEGAQNKTGENLTVNAPADGWLKLVDPA